MSWETRHLSEAIHEWYVLSLPVCVFFCSDAKERTTRSYSVSGVFNYTTLHLSKEDNMLYVGAREILFALNLTDISEVKLQRNVRAKCLYQYECSYNPRGTNMNMVVNMIWSQKSRVNITHLTVFYLQSESDFVSLLQLTWKTPEQKRGECSFKGKDLQASELLM